MSHYTAIDTQIVSAEHLVQALEDMGFCEVEVHEQPQPLRGWLGDARKQKANVIIRKKHLDMASNDLGFVQTRAGTFQACVSDFDRGRFGNPWLQKLTQRYAYHVTQSMLADQAFHVTNEQETDDGTIHLSLRRMA